MSSVRLNEKIELNALTEAETKSTRIQDEVYADAFQQGYYSGYIAGANFVQESIPGRAYTTHRNGSTPEEIT